MAIGITKIKSLLKEWSECCYLLIPLILCRTPGSHFLNKKVCRFSGAQLGSFRNPGQIAHLKWMLLEYYMFDGDFCCHPLC